MNAVHKSFAGADNNDYVLAFVYGDDTWPRTELVHFLCNLTLPKLYAGAEMVAYSLDPSDDTHWHTVSVIDHRC